VDNRLPTTRAYVIAGELCLKLEIPRLIIFDGPEGAGKTTQAQYLASWLKAQGIKHCNAVIRNNHLFAFLLIKLLIVLGRRYEYDYPNGGKYVFVDKAILQRVGKLWQLFDVLSTLVVDLFRVRIPSLLGFIVIVERYIPDACLNMFHVAHFFGLSRSWTLKCIRFLLRFAQQRDVLLVYLDAPYNELENRYLQRGSYVEPVDYLYFQKKHASFLRQQYPSLYLDTCKSTLSETSRIVVAHMTRALKTSKET